MTAKKIQELLSAAGVNLSINAIEMHWPKSKSGSFLAPASVDPEEGDLNIGSGTVGTPKPPVKP